MKFRTVALIVTLALGILLASLASDAQQPAKVPRMGLLIGSSASFIASFIETFRQALRELGYIEGQNITIEYRYAEGNYDRLPVLWPEPYRALATGRHICGQNSERCQARRPARRTVHAVQLVINFKTAKALGLTIPQSLLIRADKVIQ